MDWKKKWNRMASSIPRSITSWLFPMGFWRIESMKQSQMIYMDSEIVLSDSVPRWIDGRSNKICLWFLSTHGILSRGWRPSIWTFNPLVFHSHINENPIPEATSILPSMAGSLWSCLQWLDHMGSENPACYAIVT